MAKGCTFSGTKEVSHMTKMVCFFVSIHNIVLDAVM